MSLRISKGGSGGRPSCIGFGGVEAIGKTSLGCYAPNPIFLMSRGETGLLTLIDHGLVPETDHFEECKSWEDALASIEHLARGRTGHQTLVIDTANGLEQLCHEHVCEQRYEGNRAEFLAYGKGPDVALEEWVRLLRLLDACRDAKIGILLLYHVRIRPFKNPEGEDYDRYVPDMSEKTWGITLRWLDMALFGNYAVEVKKGGLGKGKVVRSRNVAERFFHTQRTPAYDAKNRHNLPPQIPMGNSGREAWNNLMAALKRSKAALPQRPAPAAEPQYVTAEQIKALEADLAALGRTRAQLMKSLALPAETPLEKLSVEEYARAAEKIAQKKAQAVQPPAASGAA
jgi:hypothetical protein